MNKKIIISATVVAVIGVGAALIFLKPPQKNEPASVPEKLTETPSVTPNTPGTVDAPVIPSPDNEKNNNETTKMNSLNLVTLKTTLGDITFKTYDEDAPKAVNNFLTLANKKFYNGVIFHRVIPGFMIQGGDPTGTGRGGPGYAFEDELDPNTDSYKRGYVKGTVAMANSGPDTNGSQFFIMVADYPLPNNYTIFGSVVSGQDIADKISFTPRDRSDKPLAPVVINEVVIKNAPQE